MRRRIVVGLVLTLASALGLAGCSDDGDPAAPPKPVVTAIADLDAAGLRLARIDFCDLVPVDAIGAALGAEPGAQTSWANGDRPPMDGAEADVAHEVGCSWTRGRFSARAWVFARPVDAAFGTSVVAAARARKGCTTRTSPNFGAPSLLQDCRLPQRRARVRHAGLFGDTWVTCELAGPARVSALRGRANSWCAAVVTALDAR